MIYLFLGIIIGIILTKIFYCVLFYKEIEAEKNKILEQYKKEL